MSNNPARCTDCETFTNELEHGRCLSCPQPCPTCEQPLSTNEDRSLYACVNWRCGWYHEVFTRDEMDRRIERALVRERAS